MYLPSHCLDNHVLCCMWVKAPSVSSIVCVSSLFQLNIKFQIEHIFHGELKVSLSVGKTFFRSVQAG